MPPPVPPRKSPARGSPSGILFSPSLPYRIRKRRGPVGVVLRALGIVSVPSGLRRDNLKDVGGSYSRGPEEIGARGGGGL